MNENSNNSKNAPNETAGQSDSEQLIGQYLDGVISPESLIVLEQQLKSSPSLRARLRSLATVEEGLADLASLAPASINQSLPLLRVSDDLWNQVYQSDSVPGSRNHHDSRIPFASQLVPISAWIPWLVAAACIAVYLFNPRLAPLAPASTSIVPVAVKNEAEPIAVAILLDHSNAVFSEGGPSKSALVGADQFSVGQYTLATGKIHLRYATGAEVVVQAPAEFEIYDEMNMRLESGALRAIVPETARGFTVHTPDVIFEDLGTEFGVVVDSENKRSKLHVFEGQVDVKKDAKTIKSLFDGQSAVYQYGNTTNFQSIDFSQFPAPGAAGFERWFKRKRKVAEDPDVIGYFPFVSKRKNELTNFAIKNVSNQLDDSGVKIPHGKINSARWVNGRWPGKQALLFERTQDFVDLNIASEFDEISYCVWAKIDSINYCNNSILNSNGWSGTDLHWQLRRTGTIFLAPYGSECRTVSDQGDSIPLGEWVHLAGTISQNTKHSKSYINGVLQNVVLVPDNGLIAPGPSRLGNWKQESDWKHQPVRTLQGRIDELTIWQKVLSESEIRSQYELGRPSGWAR